MDVLTRGPHAARRWFQRKRAEYSAGADRPIAGYSTALLAYGTGLGGLAGAARAAGRWPPPRLNAGDLALITITTHKLSRLIAKDPITSPLRMPFTRFEGVSAPSELHEEVRASGMGHSMGELISCPFCLSPWIASGLVAGYAVAPGATRALSTAYTAVAGADFLQYAYAATQQRSAPPETR